MSTLLAIAVAVLVGVFLAGVAMLKAIFTRMLQMHFGDEPGSRDREVRRRRREFEWYCWKAWGCFSGITSLQTLRGAPYSLLRDFSGVVTPAQAVLAVALLFFGAAPWSRFREPFAY